MIPGEMELSRHLKVQDPTSFISPIPYHSQNLEATKEKPDVTPYKTGENES